jgi:hypothetical protein
VPAQPWVGLEIELNSPLAHPAQPVPLPITGLLACAFGDLIRESWMINTLAEPDDKKSS